MISQLEKEITIRYLKTRKKDGFLNVISIFSFLGISLGVAVLIIVMSVMNGFRSELIERIEKLELQVNLSEKTRDYNLGTSLRNYIDPRIFKTWTDDVGADWEKLYTSALQKKFLWVKDINSKWNEISKEY